MKYSDFTDTLINPLPILPYIVRALEANVVHVFSSKAADERHADSAAAVFAAGMDELPVPETNRSRWAGDFYWLRKFDLFSPLWLLIFMEVQLAHY